MLATQRALQEALAPAAREITGGGPVRIATLTGDASNRRYHRVHVAGGQPPSLVVMELGDNPNVSEEATRGGTPPELPFINVQRYLERGGLAVPRLHLHDASRGLLFLEDLGDVTFESAVLTVDHLTRHRFYQLAIHDLATLQRYTAAGTPADCIAFTRSFDYDLLLWELRHFREWLLEADRGARLSQVEAGFLEDAFAGIARSLAAEPRSFVHRDYQSRNLMVQDGPRLRLIDFQDALLGTAVYDLVALLRDSYVELEPALVDRLLAEYADLRCIRDLEALRRLFDLQTVQRKLKDAGRFIFIDRVKTNPKFLPSIPASLRYVRQALERLPELTEMRTLLGRYVPELA
jgi:aminoglycoside/choline kinase family phosphotransferase